MLSSSVQNSEGRGDSDSGDSFADPCQFLQFPKTKIQLSASLRPLAKNLQKQKFNSIQFNSKIVARVNVKKIKAKKLKKGF